MKRTWGVFNRTILGGLVAALLAFSAASAEEERITINFVNADIQSVIKTVGQHTGRNFILDPRIVSTVKKVTIIAPLKMTPQEAYNVFLAALSTMGLTIVPKGSLLCAAVRPAGLARWPLAVLLPL